jgi:siroheme synthase-like protein
MTIEASDGPRFLPLGLDVRGRRCLVVGGGAVGTRKSLTLARAGAVVTVVSPTVTDELTEQIDAGRIHWVRDAFRNTQVHGVFLTVAATDDEAHNAAVVQAAVEHGSLVCDASSVERSAVIFGALLEEDDVTIAVFTDGRDPGRARSTRDEIAKRRGRAAGP